MSNTVTAGRRIDTAITGLVVAGLLLAIARGARILTYGNLEFVLTIGFPAVIATLVYLHYDRSERPTVALGLCLWGCAAGAVALFAGFFVVVDNPATVSEAPLSTTLFVNTVANFVVGVTALSGLYGAAGYYRSRLLVALAPVIQFVAFVAVAYLVPIVAGI